MLDILNVAQTGLQTSKVQVENVMNNLANENTEGYKKRVVDTSELEHADSRLTGRGVIVDGVSRITNVYMYQNLVEEEAKLNSLAELDVMLNDIESIFQETDDSGLSADLNRYFQSLENLRTSPQNEIYKDDLKNNASILVDDLKNLYIDIEARETGTLNRASDTVEEINNILDSIGQVSQEIMDSVGVPNDLYDKRDSLERELSKYIDVEISREDSYELKIGGKTAVRFDTNVHSLNLVEEYIPQADKYIIDGSLPYESSLVDPTTWNGAANAIEEQTVTLSGTATAQVSFLGTLVAGADGTAGHQTPAEIASDIVADIVNIRAKWNDENPEREIADITAVGDILTITYAALEGDVPNLPVAQSNGIDFIKNTEITKGSVDSISYILNNDITITVTHGETVTNVPIGTDPETYEDIVADETNIVRALVAKINNNSSIDGEIVAYNGAYELDKDGNKVLTNNPDHSD
ncbi:MAG: flagellar basal body protein, partial [Campylobacterota bacterium]|nr:flagellar basal body protein [Campylobacterota bacterium]